MRPNKQEESFRVFVNNERIGLRRFDDFENGVAFEANTIPWAEVTEAQLSRKLDQAALDVALLRDSGSGVTRVIWFGTDPLPSTGLGAQMSTALREGGIEYWVVVVE